MTLFNLPQPALMHRAPLLVLGAEHDQLIPPDLVHMTAATYGRQAAIFADMGHGMMLEHGWQQVATHIADWLAEREL
jgi:non-heme chloroperoxidase